MIRSPEEVLADIADERRSQHYTYVADAVSDLVLDRADLMCVFDIFGNRYVDMSSGDGVMVLGHRNPAVITAVTEHIRHHQHTAPSGEHVSRQVSAYAQALSETFNPVDDKPRKVLFCTSPDEAMGRAMELAQAFTGRHDRSAAVVLETVGADMVPVDLALTRMNADHAAKEGKLVIADERRTGYGRTGYLWAHRQANIDPDIIVLGGAGGGGFPFGAVVAGAGLFDKYLMNRRLFGASPVICQAGLSVLEQIDSLLLEHVQDCGHVFTDAVAEVRDQFPDLIIGSHGAGLAQGLVCSTPEAAQWLFGAVVSQGVLLRPPIGSVLVFTPPLVVSEVEVKWAVDRVAAACLDWTGSL